MAYQRTWTAFNTASSAYHGGDKGWVRHANTGVISRPSYGQPDLEGYENAEAGIGYAEAVAAGVQALATIAQVGIAAKQMQDQTKAQHAAADAAQRQADAAQKTADAVAAAQIQQIEAQTKEIQESPTRALTSNKTFMFLAGGAALVGLVFLLRRRRA